MPKSYSHKGIGRECLIVVEMAIVEIGAMPVAVRTGDPEFLQILGKRYGGFLNPRAEPL